MIDVENDTHGGPTLTMLNPPGGVCPPDRRLPRRLLRRSATDPNGTTVRRGTVGNALCGRAPATTFANTLNGFDSRPPSARLAPRVANTLPCTGNFGDAKGLDIWTYNQSNTVVTPLKIVATAADIRVRKSVSDSTPAVGNKVTFTVTARNLGPNAATGVVVRTCCRPG